MPRQYAKNEISETDLLYTTAQPIFIYFRSQMAENILDKEPLLEPQKATYYEAHFAQHILTLENNKIKCQNAPRHHARIHQKRR